MARWGSGFPVVARLWRELLNEFARSVRSASRDGDAVESRIRNPQSNLPLSHPVPFQPPLPGSPAAGLSSPQAGRTLFAAARRRTPQRLGELHDQPDVAVSDPAQQVPRRKKPGASRWIGELTHLTDGDQ